MKTSLFLCLFSIAAFGQSINRNGLKYELLNGKETGRVVGVEVTIKPSPLIASPHVRTIELLQLTEDIDLEMTVLARVNYYAADGSRLMNDIIQTDTTLSPDAKRMKQSVFESYTLAPKATRGSLVNPQTGVLIALNDTVSARVKEILFYQNLTKAVLIGGMNLPLQNENREQYIRYNMVAYMLRSIANRVGL